MFALGDDAAASREGAVGDGNLFALHQFRAHHQRSLCDGGDQGDQVAQVADQFEWTRHINDAHHAFGIVNRLALLAATGDKKISRNERDQTLLRAFPRIMTQPSFEERTARKVAAAQVFDDFFFLARVRMQHQPRLVGQSCAETLRPIEDHADRGHFDR